MNCPGANRVRGLAACTWATTAFAAGTGCIPIYVPSVKQDITTGDHLHVIEAARLEKPAALTKRPPPVPGQRPSGAIPRVRLLRLGPRTLRTHRS